MNMRFKTYDEAKAFILKGRNKLDRPLNHKHCRIHLRSDNYIEVRLYSTSIVQYYKSDSGIQSMSVNNWYGSNTTERKIEQITGLRVTWSHGVPILGDNRYLTVMPDDDSRYLWAGDSRYSKDHSPTYIADTMTRIRTDGSIIHEKNARRRFSDHVRAESVQSQRRINDRVSRAEDKSRLAEIGLNVELTRLRAAILLLETQRVELLAEVGHLTELHAESMEPHEGLTGVHNRI
jgi:hypothetical protein